MKLPFYDEADATELAEKVANGDVTPRELTEAALERIEARNPALNAVVHLDAERALEQADQLPPGPFSGVPFLLKDLMAEDTGQPSTGSCRAMEGWRADQDAELVRRFKAAGLNILGRTNTPELGIYGVTEPAFRGPCRNPWNPDHTPGGSSGGSGAAVGARMVPMAHAGDGGGSIRIPAAHCGLVGLKPTRARTPIGPFVGEAWGGLVVEHVVTRSVRDSARMLDAIRGPEPGAPYQVRAPERPCADELGVEPGRLRIAFTSEPLFGGVTDAENREGVEATARLLESRGHEVVEQLPPFDREALVRAYLAQVCVGVANDIEGMGARIGRALTNKDVESTTWLLGRIGHKLSGAELGAHRAAMFAATRAIEGFLTDVDVLLTPTTACPPVPVGSFKPTRVESLQMGALRVLDAGPLYRVALDQLANDALAATPNTMLFNLTGHPAISLPLATSTSGLPIGMQLVGRFGDEATLFRLAAQLEPDFIQARPTGLPGLG